DSLFAARLIARFQAPSSINAAFRLYMLPQGMFSVAVATVLFPSLARLASRNDLDGFRATVATGIRQIAFLLVPASVVSAVLAEPIVRIVYQRGDFTTRQTPVVAASLAAFSLGLVFNGFMLMLNRAFFSLQNPWTPTWVALANLGVNAALDAAFYKLGIWGIPLSTSFVNIAGSATLFVLLRRRVGGVDGRGIASSVVRIVVASALAGGVTFGVGAGLHPPARPGLAGRRAASLRRWCPRSPRAGPSTSSPVARSKSPRCRPYSPCEAVPARPDNPWTNRTSATSRSSRTSTTASRRSPIASSS